MQIIVFVQYKQKSNCKHIKIYKIITKAENSTVVLAIWGVVLNCTVNCSTLLYIGLNTKRNIIIKKIEKDKNIKKRKGG